MLIAMTIGIATSIWLSGKDPLHALALFPPWVIPMGLLMIVLCWNINALRYRLLLAAQGIHRQHRVNLGIVMATEFGYVATPFGSGGPATFLWLNRRHGVPVTTAGGVFALDQMTDLLFFLSILPLILLGLIGLPGRFHWGSELAAMGVLLVLMLLGAGLSLRHYRPMLRSTSQLLCALRLRGRWRQRFMRLFLRFRMAVIAGLNLPLRRLLALYALCAGHWLLRYGVLFMLVTALDQNTSLAYAFFVQLVSMGLGQVSFLPGGAGAVELSFGVLLAPMVPAV
ncbi:MAG TPA: lysylphosphatidylglycerol synthase transmembrane domain-containing protein, partial [Thioalkalivibrio sp.]|nr:lysylphosphatidylglycerol synthase transmembrane domain-containing protein [Thioalkalivibrio sp.]